MDAVDRIKAIIEQEALTKDSLTIKTGISYTRWNTVINRRGKVRLEEIEALGKAFPEYRFWLAFGEENKLAGQISPMTKARF